jgi:hypothetical protein
MEAFFAPTLWQGLESMCNISDALQLLWELSPTPFNIFDDDSRRRGYDGDASCNGEQSRPIG